MSFSTSPSDSKPNELRRVPWRLTWAVTLGLFFAVLLAGETAWRSLGYRSAVVDSPALWKFWYVRAVSAGPRAVVLIGSSRIQAGISMTEIRQQLPDYRIIQLGKYAGGGPIGVLRALASDDRFNGIVICDALAPFLVRTAWEDQRQLYEYPTGTRERLEAVADAAAHDIFALNNSATGMMAALKRMVNQGQLPPKNKARMGADRSIELDFSQIKNLEAFRADSFADYRSRYEAAQQTIPDELDEDFAEIDQFVRRIQARGGQVVFVSMPSSGRRLQLEEAYHPKAKYWDRFAGTSSGICIHSADLPAACRLNCPDDSHLDHNGAIRFTNALVDALRERRVFK